MLIAKHQCRVAAETHAMSLFAQAGYDVANQWGSVQPRFDFLANKGGRHLEVSVKGSQDGGWQLANDLKRGEDCHQAIERWLAKQGPDALMLLVQFKGVAVGQAPRTYVARARDVAVALKAQSGGRGRCAIAESAPPSGWVVTQQRTDTV